MKSSAGTDGPSVPFIKRKPTWWQIVAVLVIAMVVGAIIMPFPGKDQLQVTNICESHERAIGIAMLQYCDDNDGNFPAGRADGTGWAGAIEPYVTAAAQKSSKPEAVTDTEEQTWACPNDITGPDRSVDPPGLALSYSMNASLTGDTLLPNCSTKRSRITNPGSTVLLFETRGAIVQIEAPNEGGGVKPKTGWFSGVGNGMANSLDKGGNAANLIAFGRIQYETGDLGARGCIAPACLPPRHQTDSVGVYLTADGAAKWGGPSTVSSGNTPSVDGGQTGGFATGTAATSDRLGSKYVFTFSAR